MKYYKTEKICAKEIGVEFDENGKITELEGIDCRGRGTSCPDQLAKILKSLS